MTNDMTQRRLPLASSGAEVVDLSGILYWPPLVEVAYNHHTSQAS